jgi:hypothetical protein
MAKRNDLGLELPGEIKDETITFRLKASDARKLGELAKGVQVGRSTMARLIVEKFIKEHGPKR